MQTGKQKSESSARSGLSFVFVLPTQLQTSRAPGLFLMTLPGRPTQSACLATVVVDSLKGVFYTQQRITLPTVLFRRIVSLSPPVQMSGNTKHQMTKFAISLIVMLSLSSGCTSHRHVIRDERGEIAGALAWQPQFVPKDSISGIAIEFVEPPEEERESVDSTRPPYWPRVRVRRATTGKSLKYVTVTLWHYPIDTVVQVSTYEESVPNGLVGIPELSESIDVTEIQYLLKDEPIHLISEVNHGTSCTFTVPTGKYLLRCTPYGYYPRWTKDVMVRQDSLSLVKIDTVALPAPVLY